jgi:hypothetical protein
MSRLNNYLNERSKTMKTTIEDVSVILMKDDSIVLKQGSNKIVVHEPLLLRVLEFHKRVK